MPNSYSPDFREAIIARMLPHGQWIHEPHHPGDRRLSQHAVRFEVAEMMLAHASGQSSVERVCNYDDYLEPRRRALRGWQEFVMEQARQARRGECGG